MITAERLKLQRWRQPGGRNNPVSLQRMNSTSSNEGHMQYPSEWTVSIPQNAQKPINRQFRYATLQYADTSLASIPRVPSSHNGCRPASQPSHSTQTKNQPKTTKGGQGCRRTAA